MLEARVPTLSALQRLRVGHYFPLGQKDAKAGEKGWTRGRADMSTSFASNQSMELIGEIQVDSPIKQFPLSIYPFFQKLHLLREEFLIERKPQTQERIRIFREFVEPGHMV